MTETIVQGLIDTLRDTHGVAVYHDTVFETLDFDWEVRGGSLDISIDYGMPDDVRLSFLWIMEHGRPEGLLGQLYRFCMVLEQIVKSGGDTPDMDINVRPDGTYTSLIMYYPLGDLQQAAARIHTILVRLSQVDLTSPALDTAFLQNQHAALYGLVVQAWEAARQHMAAYMDSAWRDQYKRRTTARYKRVCERPFGEDDLVYTNADGTMIVGFGQAGCRAYLDYIGEAPVDFVHFYRGYTHNILGTPEGICCFKRPLWTEAWDILADFELNFGHVPIRLSYTRDKVFIRVIDLWICIQAEDSAKNRDIVLTEKHVMERMYKSLSQTVPGDYLTKVYDLKQLTASQFEHLCRDLLEEMGFTDVHIRGKTEAPDRGVDIEATETVKGLLKDEQRKWIFQCKHTGRPWGSRDAAMIPILLAEFRADRYGLFCSHLLSPTTLDRLRSVNAKDVGIYDLSNLRHLLQDYPRIAATYFPPFGD